MVVQGFSVATSPVLLLGPVDADYEALVTSAGDVWVGGTDSIEANVDGDSFIIKSNLGGSEQPTKLKLKMGDSLYAVTGESAATYIFAQPC